MDSTMLVAIAAIIRALAKLVKAISAFKKADPTR